jgi:peptidoglycan/xylan/chitin deacetylase (PgdA/CDA1 family)
MSRLAWASGGILAASAAWCGPGAAAHIPRLAAALDVPLTALDADGVSLTFDDGPHPEGTLAVLQALERAQARATFFLVAEQVERYPELARDVAARGHEVAVHGYRHRNQMRLAPRAFAADLARATAVIADVCQVQPRLYRPPYGIFTLTGLAEVRRAGLWPLLWSKWALDWRARLSPAQLARLATRGARGGDVVLLHDADWYSRPGSHRFTARAVEPIVAALRQRGLRPVTPAYRATSPRRPSSSPRLA